MLVPDDGVEVAVAVEVGEAGRAVEPHIDAVERIGGAGALGEGRRNGRAGVLEIVQVAVEFPDDGVEVAVAVEVGEARRAEGSYVDSVEWIGGAGLLREIRRRRRRVEEIAQAAVVSPDDGVELAVAVEIGEAGRAAVPHIDAVERIGGAGARDEGRRGGRSGVLEIVQGAEALPDDEVEVAVAVEVGEARRAVGSACRSAHMDAIERIGGAGALGEGRRDGRSGVLEIVQVAVVFPDDGVEVAVAVEVGEARRADEPHIDAVERIGERRSARRASAIGGEAGRVRDLELEVAARRRRIGGIGIGQVLDQRLDPCRRRVGVEGDRQRAASAARETADDECRRS